ncbi:NAD(P)-dependent alcohol dehydrogenase [Georgenia sp. EYE_87]|uniref:NAD(P)-dependent alcohol dehydrogenase n=1 Tax=Georgenia sp. EYE_87 TaxID=2853448 RepID=UPI002003CD63|nr:NAD(P)-dependent alcohol dehydrogenase [Georgenia sp. EYE_87]MCK6211064.1 NAD(P)-dependent alcohol dehydrogenase [Georgenia sp. EYE_87]
MTDKTEATARTMTAWRQTEYGGPEVVRAEQMPVPSPGRGEVLVGIGATVLNAADVRLLRGDPLLLRLAFGIRRPKQPGRGTDAAGTVHAVGEDVSGLAVGDEVVGELPGGALAEYAVSPAARLVRRPAGLAPATAAALPMAAGTAWQALERAGVTADSVGLRVLVIGASGGVGTFTVQLAAMRSAEVWALCGEGNRSLVERLGAARTFDHRSTAVEELPEASFDAIIDIAGTAPLRALRRLLVTGGTLVMVAGLGGRVLGPIPRILQAVLLSVGAKRRLRPLVAVPKPEVLAELVALAAEGRITPVIERTWPLTEAREALTHVDAGHTVGKVIVVPGH